MVPAVNTSSCINIGWYTSANTWSSLGSAIALKTGEIFQGKRRRRARRLNNLVVRAEEEVFWQFRGNYVTGNYEGLAV